MSERGTDRWLVSLLVEIVVWMSLSGTFLYLYIYRFHTPFSAAAPHLTSVLTIWFAFVGLRLFVWRWTSAQLAARWIDSLLVAIPLLALTTWYLLVLAGLFSWGRVTTWPLIKSYALQYGYLMEALELRKWYLPVAAALVSGLLVLVTFRYLSISAWSKKIVGRLSPLATHAIALLLIAAFCFQLVKLSAFPTSHSQDPFSLSFFSHLDQRSESHVIGNSPVLNAKEAAERNAYKITPSYAKRNVILIVGDALRADHMSLYGYQRTTTPFLDKLRDSGNLAIANDIRSVCAESACGLFALSSSRPIHAMPAAPMTLHEALRLHGFEVHMILGGDHTNFYGLKESYGKVDSYYDGSNQNKRYMNDDILVLDRLDGLTNHQDSKPVMFQFHLMSSHGLGLRHDTANKFMPFTNYYRWPQDDRVAPDPSEVPKAINYYDNGVVQTDQMIQALLAKLKQKGYLENALVVITGDHGEMLGEHGKFGHQQRVDEGVLHIPLVLIRYGYDGFPLRSAVSSQIDIPPTILKELGLPAPATWMGTPMQQPDAPRFVYFQQSNLVGLYDLRDADRPLKYWKDRSSGQESVFEVGADPLERNNLVRSVDPVDLQVWRREVVPGSLVASGTVP